MKSHLSSGLVVVMILSLALAFGACEKNSKWVGTWEASRATLSENDIDLDKQEISFELEIKSDGSVLATTNGESDGTSSWEEKDGKIIITDNTEQEITGTINDGGQLVVEFSDLGLTFYMDKKE